MELRKIDADNWKAAVKLTTDPERKAPLVEQWIMGNAFSMLQALYDPDWDCRLILEDNTPVGFVFYGYWRERGRYLLCRFMIDERCQGQGLGTKALPLAVEQIRAQYGCREIYLTVDDGNRTAVELYRKFGFLPTEELDDGERVWVLPCGKE